MGNGNARTRVSKPDDKLQFTNGNGNARNRVSKADDKAQFTNGQW